MVLNSNIGTRLSLYRKQLGYTQAEMSDYLNISRSQYIKYENNVALPSLKFVFKLVEKDPMLSECWLIGAETSMYKIKQEDRISQLESRIRDLENTIKIQDKLISRLEGVNS